MVVTIKSDQAEESKTYKLENFSYKNKTEQEGLWPDVR